MHLPPRPFHSIDEIAGRWQVAILDVVGWAMEGTLALSAAMPPVEAGPERKVAGVVEIPGEEVFPLFRREGALGQVAVRRFRLGPGEWSWITDPRQGVPIGPADILLPRAEVERFERRCGRFVSAARMRQAVRQKRYVEGAGPGAPPKHDWDEFHAELTRRIHAEGVPKRQAELVNAMAEWFHKQNADVVPDERTIRRKVAAVWRRLMEDGS
jgi:hypothetical protein